jgi:L-threonylcarbamoyladenylate synthase
VSTVAEAIQALRDGRLAVIPTDTVYGLAAHVESERPARALYAAKGREARRPTAVLFASVAELLERIPELPASSLNVARALLPGPLTLVVPNPARRLPWLNEQRPEALGVRVPAVSGPGKAVLEALGALVATSANLSGGRDPRRLADVPKEIRDRAAALVDGGELNGAPSTVIDITGPEPRVLREGAVQAADALAAVRAARA